MKTYSAEHQILDYHLTVEDLEELTTYGGDEARSFTRDQVDGLAEALREAISDTITEFLNHTAGY